MNYNRLVTGSYIKSNFFFEAYLKVTISSLIWYDWYKPHGSIIKKYSDKSN